MTAENGEAGSLTCIVCGNPELDELADARALVVPEPLIIFICRNCGFVMQFAERPGGPSASYGGVESGQAPS